MPIGLRGVEFGITLSRLPGEYRVTFRNGADATARIVETLDEPIESNSAGHWQHWPPERPPHSKVHAVADCSTAPHDTEGNSSSHYRDA